MIDIAVLGAQGRMGRALLTQINAEPRAKIVAAITTPGAKDLGENWGGVALTSDIRAALGLCDVLIDFSHPKAAIDAALMMHKTRCQVLVTGTTGYEPQEERALEAVSENITLVKSGNFSIGVCVLETLVEKAASTLREGWDIGVLDIHHRNKKDAPSGTALMLGKAAQKGRTRGTSKDYDDAPIEYAALRQGGVIGEHSVYISSQLETLTLSHTAQDRSVFAKGALHAALWAVKQKSGLYTMKDVLGL